MSLQENIRALDAEGISGREIARRLNIGRGTVAKYLKTEDYSPKPPNPTPRPTRSVITGYEQTIITWLTEDHKRPKKQRHTAQRVFDRLVAEAGYQGTYSPVQRFIKRYRAKNQTVNEGFLELSWAPATVQVDFGQADAIIDGVQETLHMLVVTYPHSNMRFIQGYRGETAECVCHGLRTILSMRATFRKLMIFDNATSIGRRQKLQVTESRLFAAFKAHYRSHSRYCNSYAGHEKGNVENAVGFLRRNFMVPLPEARTLEGLNRMLLSKCDQLGTRPHWRHKVAMHELFAEDKANGIPLPSVGFDAVRFETRRADKYGHLQIEKNFYAAGPIFASRTLTVGLRHDTVELLDQNNTVIRSFSRMFGQAEQTISEPHTALGLLAFRPGAWAQSPVRAQVSDPVRDWMDLADHQARTLLLTALEQASEATDFATAVHAATVLIQQADEPGVESLGMLARRIAEGLEPEPSRVDLGLYDDLFLTQHTATTADEEALVNA